jgi:predicted nucleotide-binding protein
VAQLGRALDWGSRGRGFKSRRPDELVAVADLSGCPGQRPLFLSRSGTLGCAASALWGPLGDQAHAEDAREARFLMDPATRRSAIQAIAGELAGTDELDVDSILGRADGQQGGRVTPGGWGEESFILRRVTLVKILQERDDDVIESLLIGVSPQVAIDLLPNASTETVRYPKPTVPDPMTSIFVVHGHARAELHETVRVLERATGLEVIVLHEQPNAGRTILEKFEDHAAATSYAVVLLTPDDTGRARSVDELKPRGRQNVIFELGFFFGKLGRDRVTVLLAEDVEKPSDIDGLVYITLDRSGAWKQALARELQSANIPVNYSRIP